MPAKAAALRDALDAAPSARERESGVVSALERYYLERAKELGFQADLQIALPQTWEDAIPDICLMLNNLLENATKFAAPHSSLYLGLAVHGEKAVVTVRNVGQTIPAEEIPLLFERFHKSDKSRSEDKDGYGLGLYVVKTILSQHKEQITVTSENGVTAFSFTVQMAHPMRSEP